MLAQPQICPSTAPLKQYFPFVQPVALQSYRKFMQVRSGGRACPPFDYTMLFFQLKLTQNA